MTLVFETIPHPRPLDAGSRSAALENPGFGKHFTDHMVTIRWNSEAGWHDARVEARRPFEIDPAASVLHYAQEIFEGMKAYRGLTGEFSCSGRRKTPGASTCRQSGWRCRSFPKISSSKP